jgi:hypothetical protein
MTGSSSDWFPTPPPKPLQAASATKVAFGALLIVLAVAGAAVALSAGHSSPKMIPGTAPTAPVPATAPASAADRRAAFDDCMKGMGAGSGPTQGRFGRSAPSQSFRDAFAVCRSLLQSGALDPAATGATGTLSAPAA